MPHQPSLSPPRPSSPQRPASPSAFRQTGSTTPQGEWSQGTQESLDRLPQRWSRGLLYSLIAFTGVVLPWAMLARVDEVGTAWGRLEPLGKTVQLDSALSGRVVAVNAAEGDRVTAGQALFQLDSDAIGTELLQAQTQLDGQFRRLEQQAQLISQLEFSLGTQSLRSQAQASEQQSQIHQTHQQIAAQAQALSLTQAILAQDIDQAGRYYDLYETGILSRNEAQNFGRAALETEQQQAQAQGQLAQSQIELQKQQTAYARILREGELAELSTQQQIQRLGQQRIALESEMHQTQNQIQALEQQKQQRAVTIPISGTLFQLAVEHPGAVVQPSQTIAQIAPEGTPLILRAQISARESGFLEENLPVKLKFDAYPYQDYGIVPGQIRWISPDSRSAAPGPNGSDLSSSRASSPASGHASGDVYDLEISIPHPYVSDGLTTIALSPGQTAQAEVLIRQRRILDLILDPFKQMRSRGMQL